MQQASPPMSARISVRSQETTSEPIDDIEKVLGAPVEIISGVKIYDTVMLTNPPINANPWDVKKLRRYTRQPRGKLEHIFIAQARKFIDDNRESNRQLEGLFPPIELTISTMVTAFELLQPIILKQASNIDKDGHYTLEHYLVYYQYPNRNLGVYMMAADTLPAGTLRGIRGYDQKFWEDVGRMVKLTYEGLGYDFSYFGFVKRDHPYYLARTGKVPLKPNTFEAFSFFKLAPEKYMWMANGLNTTNIRTMRISCLRPPYTDAVKLSGWKKQDLFEAIKRSGLWKDVSNLPRIMYGAGETRRMGIALKDIGMEQLDPLHAVVKGLASQPYMSHCYYEALYRKIYMTTDYIDWPLLCQLNAVSLENIRKIAVADFHANPAQVENASVTDVCRYVQETAEKRRNLTKSLALQSQAAMEGFVGQPGSRWVQPQTLQRRGPRGEAISAPTDDYQLYLAVQRYCQDPQITKEELVGYSEALNIRSYLPDNVDRYSKGDLCDYLLDFLLPKAQKYESILIDCSDPAISVRHILNAATIMELGGIFPKDVSNLSKERACEILTRYIQLLRERSRLNLLQ